jgi:hypothetical protein
MLDVMGINLSGRCLGLVPIGHGSVTNVGAKIDIIGSWLSVIRQQQVQRPT